MCSDLWVPARAFTCNHRFLSVGSLTYQPFHHLERGRRLAAQFDVSVLLTSDDKGPDAAHTQRGEGPGTIPTGQDRPSRKFPSGVAVKPQKAGAGTGRARQQDAAGTTSTAT